MFGWFCTIEKEIEQWHTRELLGHLTAHHFQVVVGLPPRMIEENRHRVAPNVKSLWNITMTAWGNAVEK
jgi:hypothetical protein